MTEDWEGAQWVLATLLLSLTLGAPLLRLGLLHSGKVDATAKIKSWTEFWGSWLADVIMRFGLVAILAWGGFW